MIPPIYLDQWSGLAVANLISTLQGCLPTWERALSLCEAYLEEMSYFSRPVQRTQLMDEVLVPIYAHKASQQTVPIFNATYCVNYLQHLALLFGALAVGSISDPEHAQGQGEHYQEIARYITSVEMVTENPSLVLIQALGLVAIYMNVSWRTKTVESAWTILTLATTFSAAVSFPFRHTLKLTE